MTTRKGIYILEIFLKEEETIEVGKLGLFSFEPGYYYYCGSAQGGLRTRLLRHVKKRKKRYWHIDYLLEHSSITRIFTWEGVKEKECNLSHLCAERMVLPVPGFASSDCFCKSHLYYREEPQDLEAMPFCGEEYSFSSENI